MDTADLARVEWLMWLPTRPVFGDKALEFMTFKKRAFEMTDAEFSDVYGRTASVSELPGETDLNDRCTKKILSTVVGTEVLEVGAGPGYLANLMSENHQVTACDIVVPRQRAHTYSFSLHMNFFPYQWSLRGQIGNRPNSSLEDLGDWFYVEEIPAGGSNAA